MAGDGNDLLYGDYRNFYINSGGTSLAAAYNLNDIDFWTMNENAEIANSTTIPHATAFINGQDQEHWFYVTMGAGETLTVDVDYGSGAPFGYNFNSIVEITNGAGTRLAYNDDSIGSGGLGYVDDGQNGNFGSYGTFTYDSYVSFTATTAGTYYVRVADFGNDPIAAGDSAVVHFSLTGQEVDPNFVGGSDTMFGGAGDDVMHGMLGDDWMMGEGDNDLMFGNEGADMMSGGSGADTIYGGTGGDMIVGDDGWDRIYGGDGSDAIHGNAGADRIYGGNGSDLIDGGTGRDLIFGGDGNNIIIGGDDRDALRGGRESDTIQGGRDADDMSSGGGRDVFIYTDYTDSRAFDGGRDVIRDFNQNLDIIDLSAIDSNRFVSGDQELQFLARQPFDADAPDGIGEVRWRGFEEGVLVIVDQNGDGTADMQIYLEGVTWLDQADFIL